LHDDDDYDDDERGRKINKKKTHLEKRKRRKNEISFEFNTPTKCLKINKTEQESAFSFPLKNALKIFVKKLYFCERISQKFILFFLKCCAANMMFLTHFKNFKLQKKENY
jgi:hypothetical protein